MIIKFTSVESDGSSDIVIKCTKANIQDFVDFKDAFHTSDEYDSKFYSFLEEFRKVHNINCISCYTDIMQIGATFFEVRICTIASKEPLTVLKFISCLTTYCKQNLNL